MTDQNTHSNPTQVFWTCKTLLNGRAISHQTEIKEVRGWRLSSIIHNLKHNYNWPIQVEYCGPQNVAYYSLRADTDRTKLRFPRSARALGDNQ